MFKSVEALKRAPFDFDEIFILFNRSKNNFWLRYGHLNYTPLISILKIAILLVKLLTLILKFFDQVYNASWKMVLE